LGFLWLSARIQRNFSISPYLCKTMFDDCHTLDHIERRKRSLVAELHPDKGGSNERFLAMMSAYEKAVERVNTPPQKAEPPPRPQTNFYEQQQPKPPDWYASPPNHHYPEPSLAERLDSTMAFITKSVELAAKAAVVYTAVMEQLDAIKAEKRKKARKPRRKLNKGNDTPKQS
jgi:hypothetical protein